MNTEAIDSALAWAGREGLVESGVAQRVRILSRLVGSTRVSGQELAAILGISRAGVHKHIRHLREGGFEVDSVAGSGYLLHSPWDSLLPEAVIAGLFSDGFAPPGLAPFIGLPYSYRPTAPSTNELLKSAAQAGLPEGAVIATDDQTEGRGRLGRSWASQPGKDLTFSYLLRPSIAPQQVHLLVLAASVAVAEALLAFRGLTGRVRIKWPNDVMIDGRKVCGILAESSMDMDQIHWVVVGLGLNVNGRPSAELSDGGIRPQPAALREALDHEVPRLPLFVALLREIGGRTARLLGGQVDELIGAYSGLDALRGRPVLVRSFPSTRQVVAAGTAQGLGANGELLIRTESGEMHAVVAGEVTLAD